MYKINYKLLLKLFDTFVCLFFVQIIKKRNAGRIIINITNNSNYKWTALDSNGNTCEY